ncbi:hypothetical protein F5Y15DRAFT_374780 [Xylariaceae sp. FL0016]|nr:hypothetical protein F5Y15DRAFT_374780 [Xylariaceae sp. FL0016]
MHSFGNSVALFVAVSGALAMPQPPQPGPSSRPHSAALKVNVCLGGEGQAPCLQPTYNTGTCYDLPTDWIGQVSTIATQDANSVCLANVEDCDGAMVPNVCHSGPADSGSPFNGLSDCTGYVMLSKENPLGWDLTGTDWKRAVKSFSCWTNGTLPALPTEKVTLSAPNSTIDPRYN